MQQNIEKKFLEIFGVDEFVFTKSPGRVNLIGDHTDYQGGYVLPIAINRYTYFYGRKRNDDIIKIYSFNYNEYFETNLREIKFNEEKKWANYILGVMDELLKKGIKPTGVEIVFGGNVPVGSGLSSSASVEIGTCTILKKIFDLKLTDIEVIEIARAAENNFVGVNCGIMDQFVIYLGKNQKALFLNCRTLDYSYVPFSPGDYRVLVVDTRKKRALSSSAYNERVEQVKKVVEVIRKDIKISCLGEINSEILEKYKNSLGHIEYKRAKHIVEENERVEKSVELLEKGDILSFGNLLYQSHKSLKELYNVSCEELDFIVEFSEHFKGVAGARLTGAGMGGCCVIIIRNSFIEEFKETLEENYLEKFKIRPAFYIVDAVNGARFQ